MWEDPADFFKTTTSPVVKEIGAGGLWIFWEGVGGLSSEYSYETKAPPFFMEVVSKKNVVLFSKACCQWNGHTLWRSKINMRIPTSGLTLVKKVVQQQKGAEFVTWPGISSQLSQLLQHGISVFSSNQTMQNLCQEDSIHLVDYATRRRQLMTLENIQALATTISEMAKWGPPEKKHGWSDDRHDYISWTFSECCIKKKWRPLGEKTQSNFEFQSKNLRLRSLWIVGGTTWVWCQCCEARQCAHTGAKELLSAAWSVKRDDL